MIEVIDINDVRIDGQPAGTVTDVLANYKDKVGETYKALQQWSGNCDKATAEEKAKAIASQADAHAAEVAKLTEAHDATCGEMQVKLDAQAEEIAALQKHVEALGGTELAKKLAAEKRRAELEAAIEQHKAELDRLESQAATAEVNV